MIVGKTGEERRLKDVKCFDEKLKKFINTSYFQEAASFKKKNGVYCKSPVGTKDYRDFWEEMDRRNEHGYSVGGVKITGYHHFFLNFKQLEIVTNPNNPASGKAVDFPRFWKVHWDFFNAVEEAEKEGLNITVVKPRGTGFSEVASSMGARDFVLPQFMDNDRRLKRFRKSFYFASNEAYLNKDGVLTKCWDNLEYLNSSSEGGYKHLRQKKDQDLHKRASYLDKHGNEIKTGGEIIGRVVDHPRKVRGGRVYKVYFEESGSFVNLQEAVTQALPLVRQGGISTGLILLWGCVCKGTKVWNSKGEFVNIEDLKQEDGIVGYYKGKGTIEPITYMRKTALKECVKITTNTGRELKCSIDHPILWSNKSFGSNPRIRDEKGKTTEKRKFIKKAIFKEAGEIKEGDQVAILDNLKLTGTNTIKDPRLIGWLIGDGSYGFDKTPRLSNADDEINYDCTIERGHVTKDGRDYKEIRIRNMCPTLRSLGIYGQVKDQKRLPDLHTYTHETATELLGGLFDADGCVTGNKIILSSCGYNLLNDVRFILQRIGIHCNISFVNPRKDKRGYYRLEIASIRDIEIFYNNIKFRVKSKQEKLNKLVESFKDKEGKHSKTLTGVRFERVTSVLFIGKQEVYNLTADSTNTYVANGMITHNTGGEGLSDGNDAGIAGLEHIFYHPEAYFMKVFKGEWDEITKDRPMGFFFPCYYAMDKYMDKDGNPDIKAAKAEHESERKRIEEVTGNSIDAIRYAAEYPFTPTDVFKARGKNDFNQIKLAQQEVDVKVNKKYDQPDKGFLHWKKSGNKVVGVEWRSDPAGNIYIVEHPQKNDGNYRNLYIAGIDSIDKGVENSVVGQAGSRFCILIKKRMIGNSGNIYVAMYKDRPSNELEAYETSLKLLWYYDCKCNLEDSKTNIISYFREKKQVNRLINRPRIGMTDKVKHKHTHLIGTQATEKMNKHGDKLIKYFIEDYYQNLIFTQMIDELQNYSYKQKTNFDIVAAMRMVEIYDEDLDESPVIKNKIDDNFQDFGWYTDSNGYRRFGIIPSNHEMKIMPPKPPIRYIDKEPFFE